MANMQLYFSIIVYQKMYADRNEQAGKKTDGLNANSSSQTNATVTEEKYTVTQYDNIFAHLSSALFVQSRKTPNYACFLIHL